MVFGWFKKKKPEEEKKPEEKKETQQTAQQKKQKEAELQWLYEYLIQYLTSPVWKIPIYDFIDENCIIFDDDEENKFEYTTIHKNFKGLIEAMVQQLMIDVGINEDQFYDMCCVGLKKKNHRKIFEQILIVDNFLVFKKLMVKRNKELEMEAMKELDNQDGGSKASKQENSPDALKQKELEKEKSELELAIAVSLAAQEESKKLHDNEDSELQKALLQSQATFEQEETLRQSKIKEQQEAEAKILSDSKIAQQQAQEKKQAEEQKQQETAKPKEQEVKPAVVVPPVQKQQKQEEEEKKQEQTLEKKATLNNLSSLPPLKASKNLPPLMMAPKYEKPVGDLMKQKENLEAQLKEYKSAEDGIKNAKVDEPAKKDEESLDERKKRLLQQRELLRKKKQKQREEELKRFKELGTTEDVQGEQKQEAVKKQQSIALDLEKQMPQSNISTEERKKRLDLYSKIKADME